MSRRRVRDLPDLVEDSDIDEDQYVDIAFVPADHESSDGDSDVDLEEDITSHDLPTGSYEHVKSTYTSTQKLLEPNHIYDWEDDTLDNISPDIEDNSNLSAISPLFFKNSLELFELFFSESMKNHVVEATAENQFDLSKNDLERFIVIIMITIFNSRKRLYDYWSTKRILECPIITELMTRNKFVTIKKNIRFYKHQDENPTDKVWKVRTMYDMFRENCMQFGFFDYNLSVDEVMVKYFGRFGIKQCIRNKPIRFGIKMWALCSSDGYIYDLDIYTGKSGNNTQNVLASVGLGSRVVIQLLSTLLEGTEKEDLSKYHVYFDNFFSNPDLMIHLKKNGLSSTGTVRQNRVKEKVEMPKKAKRGTTISKHEANSGLNFITVMDSKPVSILSTKYGDEPKVAMQRWQESSKNSILFPHSFFMYNQHMGGVDLHDQHCNALMPSIRGKKWTWCLFMRLIQASLANATVIYNKLHPDEKKGSKDIVQEVCEYYIQKLSSVRIPRKKRKPENSSEHIMKQGSMKKCGIGTCSTRTEWFCTKCCKPICRKHKEDHGNEP